MAPVLGSRIDAGDELAAVHYSDRYLTSPLSVRLLHEVLKTTPGLTARTALELQTASVQPTSS